MSRALWQGAVIASIVLYQRQFGIARRLKLDVYSLSPIHRLLNGIILALPSGSAPSGPVAHRYSSQVLHDVIASIQSVSAGTALAWTFSTKAMAQRTESSQTAAATVTTATVFTHSLNLQVDEHLFPVAHGTFPSVSFGSSLLLIPAFLFLYIFAALLGFPLSYDSCCGHC